MTVMISCMPSVPDVIGQSLTITYCVTLGL